jgi:RNA polymerase-binding protein DksA
MDKKTLAKIKDGLLKQKQQIEEDLKKFTKKDTHEKDEHRTEFPSYGDKSDENVQEIDDYSTNLAKEQVLENSLRDINNALDRIKDGKYGICKYCGEEIDAKRLIARPVASACIKCKTKLQNAV